MFKSSLVKWVLTAVCAVVMMTGCESNDSDDSLTDSGSGSTTVSGILDSISGDWVPAAVQGITVDLVQDGKTILRTMTKADGSFTFYNVPAGAFTLLFHIEGQQLTRPLTVEESASGSTTGNVVLGKVKVSTKGEIVDVVEIEGAIEVSVVVEPASSPAAVVNVPVTFTALADLSLSAGVQAGLGSGLPTGGVYSGPGVTDDGNGTTYSFDPATSGAGTHTITYTLGTASASDDVQVFAGPDPSLITATHNGPVSVGTDLVFTIVAPANVWVKIGPNAVYLNGASGVNGSTVTFAGASITAPSESIVLTQAYFASSPANITILNKTITATVN